MRDKANAAAKNIIYRQKERENSPGKVGTWRTNARMKKLGLPVVKWSDYKRTDQQWFHVVYKKARELGSDYVVDHILSLQDGGQHTWDNVQVITRWENDFKETR